MRAKEDTMFGTGQVSRGIAHHPYPIQNLNELPLPLMQLANQYTHLFDSFDFMMVVPNQSFLKGLFGRRFVPQQALLFYPEGVLHLQDAKPQERAGKATLIEARDLRRLRSSLLLLYGKLEISAKKDDTTQEIEVEYNTIAHDRLKPFIQRLLRCSWAGSPAVPVDLPRFELPEVAKLPFKFQSGLRVYGLQPQEELCGLVFQPEILEPRLGFFRRKISPNTLIALTDRQIVLIQEEIASTSNYGWVITYWPRQHVKKIHAESRSPWQILYIKTDLDPAAEKTAIVLDPSAA
jgi:hypothetical protein